MLACSGHKQIVICARPLKAYADMDETDKSDQYHRESRGGSVANSS